MKRISLLILTIISLFSLSSCKLPAKVDYTRTNSTVRVESVIVYKDSYSNYKTSFSESDSVKLYFNPDKKCLKIVTKDSKTQYYYFSEDETLKVIYK